MLNSVINQWTGLLKDGSVRFHDLEDMGPAFLEGINAADFRHFWYINRIGNKVFGVDVEQRLFLINGCLLQLPLPPAEYRLIACMQTPVTSDGKTPLRYFCFGLQATVEGKNIKRLFIIYPDGTVSMEE